MKFSWNGKWKTVSNQYYSSLISSTGWQLHPVDQLWHRRTPADFRICIALWVWWQLSLEASVCIFSFSFSEVFSVKYHSQSHWLNWKWMSSVTNLPPPYLLLDFQFPAQEKSGSFRYKAHWIHWISRDSIDPRKTVDSQPQYVVVRIKDTHS